MLLVAECIIPEAIRFIKDYFYDFREKFWGNGFVYLFMGYRVRAVHGQGGVGIIGIMRINAGKLRKDAGWELNLGY